MQPRWFISKTTNGKLRFIQNAQELNSVTIRNAASISRLPDVVEAASGHNGDRVVLGIRPPQARDHLKTVDRYKHAT
jgi:hypothetical protein